MNTAKVFWSGRSQAIRLPKTFRFDVDSVRIKRRGKTVLLEPVVEDWQWLDRVCGELDKDFIHATREKPAQQQRPLLDKDEFFK